MHPSPYRPKTGVVSSFEIIHTSTSHSLPISAHDQPRLEDPLVSMCQLIHEEEYKVLDPWNLNGLPLTLQNYNAALASEEGQPHPQPVPVEHLG